MTSKCPSCGKLEAHYVPPSMGEVGFYICALPSIKVKSRMEMGNEARDRIIEATLANLKATTVNYPDPVGGGQIRNNLRPMHYTADPNSAMEAKIQEFIKTLTSVNLRLPVIQGVDFGHNDKTVTAAITMPGETDIKVQDLPTQEYLVINPAGIIIKQMPGPWPSEIEPLRLVLEAYQREIQILSAASLAEAAKSSTPQNPEIM